MWLDRLVQKCLISCESFNAIIKFDLATDSPQLWRWVVLNEGRFYCCGKRVLKNARTRNTHVQCPIEWWMGRTASTKRSNWICIRTQRKKGAHFCRLRMFVIQYFLDGEFQKKWRNALAIQYVWCVYYGIGYCTHVITTTNFVNMAQSIQALKLIFTSRPNLRPSLLKCTYSTQYQQRSVASIQFV